VVEIQSSNEREPAQGVLAYPHHVRISLAAGVAHLDQGIVQLAGRELQLLAAIGLGSRRATSEALIDEVWPGADPVCARRSFKVYIHRIRARLGRFDALQAQLGCWSFGPNVTIDVWEWERLAAASRVQPLLESLRAALSSAWDGLVGGPAPVLTPSGVAATVEMHFAELRDHIADILLEDAYVRADANRMRSLASTLIAIEPRNERWKHALARSRSLAAAVERPKFGLFPDDD
jgi:hypothetical protein